MHADLAVARDHEKTGTRKAMASPERPIAWRDILGAVQGDDARQDVLSRYRAAGFTPDDFSRLIAARQAACDALTYAEHALELRSHGRMTTERLAMMTVRRRLEIEVWS